MSDEIANDSDFAQGTNEQQDPRMEPSGVEEKLEAEEMVENEADGRQALVMPKATMEEDDDYDLHAQGSQTDEKAQGSIFGLVKKGFARLAEKPKSAQSRDVADIVEEMDGENERWMLNTKKSSSEEGSDMVGATIIVPSEPSSLHNSSEHSVNRGSEDSSPALSLRPSMLSSSILDGGRQENEIDQAQSTHNDEGTILGSTTDSVFSDDKIEFLLNVQGSDALSEATAAKSDVKPADNNEEPKEYTNRDATDTVAKVEVKEAEVCSREGSDQTSKALSLTKEGHLKSSFEAVGKNLYLSDKSSHNHVGGPDRSNTSKDANAQGEERELWKLPTGPEDKSNKVLKKLGLLKCIFILLPVALLLLILYIGNILSRYSKPTPPEMRRIEANHPENEYFDDDTVIATEKILPSVIVTEEEIMNETETLNVPAPAANLKFPLMYIVKNPVHLVDKELCLEQGALENFEDAAGSAHINHESSKIIPGELLLGELAHSFQKYVLALARDDIRHIVNAIRWFLIAISLWVAIRWVKSSLQKLSSYFKIEKHDVCTNGKKTSVQKSPPRYMKYHNASSVFASMYTAVVINRKGECVEVKRSSRNFEIKAK